jgi:hypothetical protein
VSKHSIDNVHAVDPGMDVVMAMGFFVAFLILVCLLYRHEFKTRLPLLPILFGASAIYGFLAGVWLLGFVLCAVSADEFRRWWKGPTFIHQPCDVATTPVERTANVCESRMSRMFGR